MSKLRKLRLRNRNTYISFKLGREEAFKTTI